MHIYIYVRIYVNMYICKYVYMQICIYIVNIYIYEKYINKQTLHIIVCIHVYIYVCMYSMYIVDSCSSQQNISKELILPSGSLSQLSLGKKTVRAVSRSLAAGVKLKQFTVISSPRRAGSSLSIFVAKHHQHQHQHHHQLS